MKRRTDHMPIQAEEGAAKFDEADRRVLAMLEQVKETLRGVEEVIQARIDQKTNGVE